MKHPEVFIIPIMMLSDYFLTVWGVILSEKKYQQHFKIEHYELNPIWQKNIANKQWFNPKHLIAVAVVAVFCLVWSNGWTDPDAISEGLFGFFTILYASIIGNHLSNVFTFSYVIRHPENVSGEVTTSYLLALKTSQFHALSLFFILFVIAIFSPTPFVIGGACSQMARLFNRWRWLAKANAQKKVPPKIL